MIVIAEAHFGIACDICFPINTQTMHTDAGNKNDKNSKKF